MSQRPTVLKTVALRKVYQTGSLDVPALQGVDIEIKKGEFVSIMGPSGSGKSTFMHLLGCLDRPTTGRYILDGVGVETLDDMQLSKLRNQKVGFVFQNFNLIPQLTVIENIELPLGLHRITINSVFDFRGCVGVKVSKTAAKVRSTAHLPK